jgi:hypothetical protein
MTTINLWDISDLFSESDQYYKEIHGDEVHYLSYNLVSAVIVKPNDRPTEVAKSPYIVEVRGTDAKKEPLVYTCESKAFAMQFAHDIAKQPSF